MLIDMANASMVCSCCPLDAAWHSKLRSIIPQEMMLCLAAPRGVAGNVSSASYVVLEGPL